MKTGWVNWRKFLKIGLSVVVAAAGWIAGRAAGPSFGEQWLANEGWLFYLAEEGDSCLTLPSADEAWRIVDLPHDWSIEAVPSPTLPSCQGYYPGGIAWYKKTFSVHFNTTGDSTEAALGNRNKPGAMADDSLEAALGNGNRPEAKADDRLEAWLGAGGKSVNKPGCMENGIKLGNGEKLYIYFEGIYNRSRVYVNGEIVGERPNGYVSTLYDLTPHIAEGKNEISVRVDHSRIADSRWYTGSGIYRDAYFVKAPETHFSLWGIGYETIKADAKRATIKVSASVDNAQPGMKINVTLYNNEGKAVASASKKAAESNEMQLQVASPKLWNINEPNLYRLELSLVNSKGEAIDHDTETAGIRTIKFDPDKGFFLNGQNMKIKGACIHHDAGVLGAAVPRDVWKRRLQNLKKIGVNALRMSHNPQAPALYDLCDELGFVVMDEVSDEWEFPKRKWVKGWNEGKPAFDGSYDFFEEWIERDITDMTLRDRNHPSIILWSIGNEVDYPNDPYSHPVLDGDEISQPMYGGYNPDAPRAERIGVIAERLAKCVRAVDTSRPVTGALAGVAMSNQTAYPQAVDVVGYNYTEKQYDTDHETYPERIIYGSETSVRYDSWRAVRDRDFIAGQFVWTGADYLGESRKWPSRGLNTGLLNFASLPKGRGQFRASLWLDEPFTYAGAYPAPSDPSQQPSIEAPAIWNWDEGQMIRVVCYTNAPMARLTLNGAEYGEPKPYDDETGVIWWDVPFAPGELKAIGCDQDGNALSASTMRTSGRPYALRARIDGDYTSEPGGVNHIIVEIADEDGNLVTLADNAITCKVEGAAKLLGLEGSSNTDMTANNSKTRRASGGYILAYVRNEGEGGATITFKSPLLQPATITLP